MSKVLVIGDLHAPFIKEGYLEHCKKVYKKYKCDEVVFIGDVIDAHYSSFHVSDPDGYGGEDELDLAVNQIKKWHKAFPNATVILGNHDRIVTRKAKMANLPSKWIRDFNEVLHTPTWTWEIEHYIDDVLYVHGEASTARTTVKNEGCSVVQGHRHSDMYVEYMPGNRFAMQTGCGVDRASYAMEYARAYKKQMIGCGVVIDGITAYIEPFNYE